ncbi:MAG TPA: glutamine-hydrolyzing GMP synthase, partial [bacterium]|nr:glutamine-hydrolyzing GMP synthase [bacterium]
MKHDLIIVLDFGAQYSQLIARRVREAKVYCEILPYHTPVAQILARAPRGIILSGGPASVYAKGAPHVDPALFQAGVPLLGICYGMQLMSQALKGRVQKASHREFGLAPLQVKSPRALFARLPSTLKVWMSHGDQVTRLPGGFKTLASTSTCPFAAAADEKRKLYGIQFHPEVVHTQMGSRLLENFVLRIAGARPTWTMGSYERT